MANYYAILGLEPAASQESIKVAYRRLAREVHPDAKANSTERERSDFSLQMAQLNEAYSVLSDVKQRREYDEKLRIQGILTAPQRVAVAETKSPIRAPSVERTRHRTKGDTDAAVVAEYSKHLRERFLTAKNQDFTWKERSFEGFDWALESFFWSTHYCVALRGFALLNPGAIRKFANYAQIVTAQHNRAVRTSYFLFPVAFEQLDDWDAVSAQSQSFVSGGNGSKIPINMLLLDMRHSRTLRIGAQQKDKRFEQLIQFIGIPTT